MVWCTVKPLEVRVDRWRRWTVMVLVAKGYRELEILHDRLRQSRAAGTLQA
jgi:hypothetical protein